MNWHTHLAFGFLIGLIALPLVSSGNVYIFFIFVLFGALLPDIDQPNSKLGRKAGIISQGIKAVFGHRGIVHTIWGGLVLCGLFWYFINQTYGAAMFIGFFSHLLADGFTKMGINFIHPVGKLHMAGFIETGSVLETIFLIGTILLIGIIVI